MITRTRRAKGGVRKMQNRQERDHKFLEALEEITQALWKCKEKYNLLEEENHPQALRFKALEEKLTTERRILEELSLPCRFILEHFSTFMGKPDQTLGFRLGMMEVGRSILNDIAVSEWGNVNLIIGNIRLGWRDGDYQYLFYPDKVILRSLDRSKPEITLFFNFAFKYSKLIPEFKEVPSDGQTLYCHPDLFENQEE